MAEQTSLDDVLKEPAAPEVKETPPPQEVKADYNKQAWRDKEQEAKGNVRDPVTGQYAPKVSKEEVKAEPPKEPEVKAEPPKEPVKLPEEYSAKERAAFAALADERRKRQALERQLQEQQQKKEEKPFFEDPEGALARQRKELEDRINYVTLSTKVQTSESIARSRHQDYDEKFAVFNQMVQEAPQLAEQAFASPDPAEFAYKTAKMQKDLQDAGGLEQMKAKMEAELRAKIKADIEAELKKRDEELQRQKSELPGSLTDIPSKGVNRPVWGGPTALDDILKG